jgi:hypothetical protein
MEGVPGPSTTTGRVLPTLVPIVPSLDNNCDVVPIFGNGPNEGQVSSQCGTGFFAFFRKESYFVTAKHVLFQSNGELVVELWFPVKDNPVVWLKVRSIDGLLWKEDPELDLVLFPKRTWDLMGTREVLSPIHMDVEEMLPREEMLKKASRAEEVAMFCYPLLWEEGDLIEPMVRYGRTSWRLGLERPGCEWMGFTSLTTNSGDSGSPLFWIRNADAPKYKAKNYEFSPSKPECWFIGIHTDSFNHLKNRPVEELDHLQRANITGFVQARFLCYVCENNITVEAFRQHQNNTSSDEFLVSSSSSSNEHRGDK